MFNTKKRFFKEKIDAVTKTIWEMEFKLSKSRQIREGVRLDRDKAMEAINNIVIVLEKENNEDKKEQYKKEKANFEENIKRYEKQMEMLDKQINGFIGDETHEPIVGIIEQIKSYTELRLMYQQHIDSL